MEKISTSIEFLKAIPNEIEFIVAAVVKRDTHKAQDVYYDIETKILEEFCQDSNTSRYLD